jgi:hypothetical protein
VNNTPAGFQFVSSEHPLGIFSSDSYSTEKFAMSSYTDAIGFQFFIFYTLLDDEALYLCSYAVSEVFEIAVTRPPGHWIYERE